jgi:hypothetical protein
MSSLYSASTSSPSLQVSIYGTDLKKSGVVWSGGRGLAAAELRRLCARQHGRETQVQVLSVLSINFLTFITGQQHSGTDQSLGNFGTDPRPGNFGTDPSPCPPTWMRRLRSRSSPYSASTSSPSLQVSSILERTQVRSILERTQSLRVVWNGPERFG